MPYLSSFSFQNAASPVMEQMIMFHNHVMIILILIVSIVLFNIISSLKNTMIDVNIIEHHHLELFWTLIPMMILLFIGFPSIRLLYILDEIYTPSITVKAVGHQWYWSYEYSDFNSIEFDSYMIPTQELSLEGFRLIDVDNRTVLPVGTQTRMVVTSADVIHSWTVPSLGVKADAIPGRLNQMSFFINHPGLFFGQCSEICGANHSFMPITVESVNTGQFIKWIKKM